MSRTSYMILLPSGRSPHADWWFHCHAASPASALSTRLSLTACRFPGLSECTAVNALQRLLQECTSRSRPHSAESLDREAASGTGGGALPWKARCDSVCRSAPARPPGTAVVTVCFRDECGVCLSPDCDSASDRGTPSRSAADRDLPAHHLSVSPARGAGWPLAQTKNLGRDCAPLGIRVNAV